MRWPLYPAMFAESALIIDYEKLRERRGIKALIFDIDNTIAPFDVADPPENAMRLLLALKAKGFSVCLLSNNSRARVLRFNKAMRLFAVHRAGKPGSKGVKRAMRLMKSKPKNTAIIGDQVFTDVLCGNIWGLYTILVRPVSDRDEFTVRLKRGLEKMVLKSYHKRRRKAYGKRTPKLHGNIGR